MYFSCDSGEHREQIERLLRLQKDGESGFRRTILLTSLEKRSTFNLLSLSSIPKLEEPPKFLSAANQPSL